MTSGAVQPPGSHGKEIVHCHDSSEDSDHTSFTDDENGHQKHDEPDEEQRLMKSGGSGIPIGPVCFLSIL
jgi:carboxy-terminal domain RNA polymerase II polypeptide A small phosphatase